jgi:hypothetical protein
VRLEPRSIDDLVREGRLVPQAPDAVTLADMLTAADRDVAAADANSADFSSWADAMLYEAGLRAARVIVQAGGFRIDATRAHVTAIDAADVLTRREHHLLFVRLHRMRRRRHEFMYEVASDPTEQDLAQAGLDVRSLIELARAALEALR